MANEKTMFEKYRTEKCLCPNCKKDYIIPFKAKADKAHSFYCPKCNYEVHQAPAINID
ncbi:DNA-directed RNA polymerase [Ruminococcus flavefaciens]|uniref:DNA-directed RNA polymerase n=1 Tax=Ruminococcus flavefaciens TaxID=1265 RepID=UPI0011612F7C|nr:DNA-directed RNA polymerase [Ruminococcus flavefaciens]